MIRFSIALLFLGIHTAFADAPASIIETDHFKIYTDFELSYSEAVGICRTAEATYEAVTHLPLTISPNEAGEPYTIRIVSKPIELNQHHGARNASGIYLPKENQAIVHFTSKAGSRADHQTLMHEITHQLHGKWLSKLPVWLSEGLAVYVASLPYNDGRLDASKVDLARSSALFRFQSKEVHFIKLKQMLNLNRSEWNQLFESNPHGVDSYYLTAYLLTHYFMHMSDSKASEILNFKKENADTTHICEKLLSDRSIAELESDMINAFAKEQFALIPMDGHPDVQN